MTSALLLSAARRFVFFLVAIGGATVLISLALGTVVGSTPGRAISVGFYSVGSFLLVVAFAVGNRGPLRMQGGKAKSAHSLSHSSSESTFWGTRAVRWATVAERNEILNTSAVFVALGLVLVILGVVVDARFRVV